MKGTRTITKHQDLNQLDSSFVANIDGKSWKSMEISSTLFDFQTLELISQTLQPSQNGAKDPRRTPDHGTSNLLRGWIWNFNFSTQVLEIVRNKNPTCGVEAELGIQIATKTALD